MIFIIRKPLFNVGMAASGALVLGLAGAFTYQYRSNLKLEEEISSQKVSEIMSY